MRRVVASPCTIAAWAAALSALAATATPASAQEGAPPALDEIVAAGLNFLETKGQAADGTFSSRAGPGLTALAVTAALRNGRGVDDPMVSQGLDALERFVQADGGVYGSGRLRNYETCVAMVCFAAANVDGRYDDVLDDAKAFVTRLQFGPGGERDATDPTYGGVGYGGSERPDLSNTSYLIDALAAAGAEENDPAIQRALVFVSRCQNLASEHNDTPYADKVNDGGFYYLIPTESVDADDSERAAPSGGLRSYGSMTYAGLKSMIYAGLTENDPRVQSAVDWIGEHYAVDTHPGQGNAGLYYYYHTFGAALNAAGLKNIVDEDGVEHDWRAELIAELGRRQNEDGSWTNENGRWFENDPNLATSFALISLSYCRPPSPTN